MIAARGFGASIALAALSLAALSLAALSLAACDPVRDDGPRSIAQHVTDDAGGSVLECGLAPTEGCPCTGEGSVECRLDPVHEDGRILCPVGRRTCHAGVWGGCEGVELQPAPSASTPGMASEALVIGPVQCSACEPRCFMFEDEPGPGDLTPDRARDVIFDPGAGGVIIDRVPQVCAPGDPACTRMMGRGPGTGGPGWAPTPMDSEGVVVDPADGALVLGVMTGNSFGVWIASMDDGTVSRLDPVNGREVARYPSARPDAINRARPWNEACNWSNRGNCPSRTAVDQNFDAYVANRAFGNQGTVTKYAARVADCIDRNGNGTIETSRDANGNGRIDMGSAVEFPGVNDECILWSVPVDVNDGVPRALAVGVAPVGVDVGDVWVGMYNTQRACRLSPTTGASLGCRSIAPVYPYGAVSDPLGRIWFTSRAWSRNTLGYMNPTLMTWNNAPIAPLEVVSYGIGLWASPDLLTTYIFVADSDRNQLYRYNPTTLTWFRRDLSSLGLWITPRGIGADETHLWVANWSTSSGWGGGCSRTIYALRIPNLDGGTAYNAPSTWCYTGVGVSFDRGIWAVSAGTNSAGRLAPDRASWLSTPAYFVNPYTYSDFIGFGLNFFANPRGHHQFTVDSGTGCTTYRWSQLTWMATTPPGTTVEMFVRSANTTAGLAAQPWIGPFTGSPANLMAAPGPVPPGRYLEVDVRLATADRRTTPRVYGVTATGLCDSFLYDPSGSYRRDYDSTSRCAINERPSWGDLTWRATTPAGTRIDFEIRGADTMAALPGTTPVIVSTPPSTSPVNIDARLMAAGRPLGPRHLSITAVLRPTADRRTSPTLFEFGTEYLCLPAE